MKNQPLKREDVVIRPYHPQDEREICDITYITGFKGEDLTGRRYFNDRRLFFYLFIYYYTRFEPQHFFVAEYVPDDKVIGFICGTPDSFVQDKRFMQTMSWRLVCRSLSVTLWRYPGTFVRFLHMLGMFLDSDVEAKNNLYREYPAHLHINMMPGYQGLGLGSRLLGRFEDHMIAAGASGMHLITTNYNRKAVPFYEKQGYTVYRRTLASHPTLDDLETLVFVKKLEDKTP